MLVANIVSTKVGQWKYLAHCIDQVVDQVDLVMVTAHYLDDDSVVVAESLGAKAVQVDGPIAASSFYNVAWRNLRSYLSHGDWVLSLRGNEQFFPPPLEAFDQSRYDVLGVLLCTMWTPNQFRLDGEFSPAFVPRIFRYRPYVAVGDFVPDYVHEFKQRDRYLEESGAAIRDLTYIEDQDKVQAYKHHELSDFLDVDPKLAYWPD